MTAGADSARPYVAAMTALDERYGGFTSPWSSTVDADNGEDRFTELVDAHLAPGLVVVEAGCGDGRDAVRIAPIVRSVLGYDMTPAFVRRASARARASGCANSAFVVADSSPKRNGGRPSLPVRDGSVDLIISRRGPSSWIGDARRACRPGARLIQVAFVPPPTPEWNHLLPAELQLHPEVAVMPDHVLDRLDAAGIELHHAEMFDAAERFDAPEELFARLAWESRVVAPDRFPEFRDALEAVFEHCTDGGPVIRQRRYLWEALL